MNKELPCFIRILLRAIRWSSIPYGMVRAYTVAGSPGYDSSWSVVAAFGLEALCCFLFVHFVVIGIFQAIVMWTHYVRRFGFPDLSSVVVIMFDLDGYTIARGKDVAMFVTFVIVGIIFVTSLTIWQTDYLLYLGGWAFWMIIYFAFEKALPPTVLFLSASGPEAEILERKIMAIIPWAKVATLVHYNWERPISTVLTRGHFRTQDSANWKFVFEQLAIVAPVVVIDARQQTEQLEFELRFMRNEVRRGRCVVLVDSDDAECFHADQCVKTEKSLLLEVLKYYTDRGRCPKIG
jgi:hypothetical protein